MVPSPHHDRYPPCTCFPTHLIEMMSALEMNLLSELTIDNKRFWGPLAFCSWAFLYVVEDQVTIFDNLVVVVLKRIW